MGFGKYFIDRLIKAMRYKEGVLVTGTGPTGTPVVELNAKALGVLSLDGKADFVSKWAVPEVEYKKEAKKVGSKNAVGAMQITEADKFKASGCFCLGIAKFGECAKWFKYDARPWCIVNKGCKGAVKNPRFGWWKYCA